MNTVSILGLVAYNFVALGLGILGMYIIIKSLTLKKKVDQSIEWPMVLGEIPHTTIQAEGGQDGGSQFIPKVTFFYQVADRVLDGFNLTFGTGVRYKICEEAERVIKKFPEGCEVNVCYYPDNPEVAVLDLGFADFRSGLVTGSILISVIALMGCILIAFLRII